MPVKPEEFPWDLEDPGSRFTLRVAFAISGSEETEGADARDTVVRDVGEWVFEGQPELGAGRAVASSVGRGASAWVAAVEWVAQAAAAGVIGSAAWTAVAAIRRRLPEEHPDRRYLVSRGAAAHLAAAAIADEFGESEPLEIEAVEEPSAIAGAVVSELSYIGLEPWVVLLRNRWENTRYVVVVGPDGEILGLVRAPMDQWENMYLPAPRVRGRLPWDEDDPSGT